MSGSGTGVDEAWLADVARVVRRVGPEVLDQIAVLAASLADALRENGAHEGPPSGSDGLRGGGPGARAPTPGTPGAAGELPRLVRIDVSR